MTRPSPPVTGVAVSTNGQAPPPARTVNVGRVALGVLLVVGLGAVFGLKYAEAGHRKAVLAIARAVPAGQAIAAADLTEALVSADPSLHPVPASQARTIVGRTAAVALVPGTLLSTAELATGPVLPAGRDVVGLSLKAGQVALGVRVGDHVMVVRTPTTPANAAGSAGVDAAVPVVARNAQVVAVDAASAKAGGAAAISVVVDAGDAAVVAAAGASGQAALVVEGGR